MPASPPQQPRSTQATPAATDRPYLDAAAANLLGRRVSAWLAMHRVQSRTLAAAMGTSITILSRTVHGAKPFPRDLARRLCDYTGLDPDSDSVTYDPDRHAPRPPAPKRKRQRPSRPARLYDGEPAYTSGQAARTLGVTVQTLVNWEDEGKLTSHRTNGGHRRYTRSQLAPLLPPSPRPPQEPASDHPAQATPGKPAVTSQALAGPGTRAPASLSLSLTRHPR
jgi:excisionase family DNA binding protein